MLAIGDPPPCPCCGNPGGVPLGPVRHLDPVQFEVTGTMDFDAIGRLEALEERVRKLEAKQTQRKPRRISRLSSGGPLRRGWSGY